MSSITFATSVLRGLQRTLEGITGSVDAVADKLTTKQLDRRWTRKLVADAVKDELMFMRMLDVFLEVTSSYRDKSGLKPIGTRWVYTNEGDAANPFVRARLVARETERMSSTFAATPPLTSLKFMLSRDMTGKRRAPADDAVLVKTVYGTKDAAQCFDVASEHAMMAMVYTTGCVFSLSLSFECI